MWALAGGLLLAGAGAGRVAAVAVAAAVALAGAIARRPGVGLLAAALALAGAAGGQARLAALDRTELGPLLGRTVGLDGVVVEPARARPIGGWSTAVRIGAGGVAGAAGAGAGERVVVRWDGPRPPGVGEEVALRGRLEPLGRWEAFAARRGAHAALEATALRATGRRRGGLAGVVDAVRRRAEAGLAAGLPPPQAALARGMVLGQDDALDDRTRDAFRASGLGHLLAASGQNVALLALFAGAAVMAAGGGRRLRLAVALGLVVLYVPLAGAGPSIVRAGIMGGAGLVAGLAGRGATRRHALALAAVGTLALNPRAAGDPGWQLSFAAVIAIAALAPGLRRALTARRVPGGAADAAAMTVAATLGTAPLVAVHFGQLSLVSVPANLAATAAVAPVVWLGTLAGAIGQLGGLAAPALHAVNGAAALPLGFVALVADAAARVPSATVPVALGAPAAAAAYAVLALVAASGRVRGALARAASSARIRAVVAGALAALVVVAVALRPQPPAPPARPTVTFLDVGQGDAILLQEGATAVLVDTGPPGGGIADALADAGVRRLDLLVLTHGEADHLGAAAAVLGRFDVGAVLDGSATAPADPGFAARTAAAIAASGARRIVPAAGQRLRAGRFELRVLWPPRGGAPAAGASPNDRAVVLHVRRGELDLLLTADAETPVTAALPLPPVEVLKVAHHGSDDPGLPRLLERVRPGLAAIQAGADNPYGHPTPATLAALRAAVPRVVRTDRDGTIRLTLVGDRIEVETER